MYSHEYFCVILPMQLRQTYLRILGDEYVKCGGMKWGITEAKAIGEIEKGEEWAAARKRERREYKGEESMGCRDESVHRDNSKVPIL